MHTATVCRNVPVADLPQVAVCVAVSSISAVLLDYYRLGRRCRRRRCSLPAQPRPAPSRPSAEAALLLALPLDAVSGRAGDWSGTLCSGLGSGPGDELWGGRLRMRCKREMREEASRVKEPLGT